MAAMISRVAGMDAVGVEARLGEIGGAGRFRLWAGRSGRRHVFTRVDGGGVSEDLCGAVVALTRAADGHLLWVGPAEDAPQGRIGVEIFAHWLAETDEARSAVIADLGDEARGRVDGSRAERRMALAA